MVMVLWLARAWMMRKQIVRQVFSQSAECSAFRPALFVVSCDHHPPGVARRQIFRSRTPYHPIVGHVFVAIV